MTRRAVLVRRQPAQKTTGSIVPSGLENQVAVNLDKPDRWKADIAKSVDMYNTWFMRFAPEAFRVTRSRTTRAVENALKVTDNLTRVEPEILSAYPGILPTLRMSTCPPLAVDRLIGLANVSAAIVKRLESNQPLPARKGIRRLNETLQKVADVIQQMIDPDLFPWLGRAISPTETELHRAATIVADRLCGSLANPIIRNAQEKRQLRIPRIRGG